MAVNLTGAEIKRACIDSQKGGHVKRFFYGSFLWKITPDGAPPRPWTDEQYAGPCTIAIVGPAGFTPDEYTGTSLIDALDQIGAAYEDLPQASQAGKNPYARLIGYWG
jgi:hypothetical protein